MPRLRLAALLAALAVVPACTRGDGAAGTSSPEDLAAHAQTDWAAWEPESFARAKADDRIILINVVASWCHWCHVMDEDTYADPEIAALLAEHFVTIRVDSDARPDVAERYRSQGLVLRWEDSLVEWLDYRIRLDRWRAAHPGQVPPPR
mgnify:CR=1 FL=1